MGYRLPYGSSNGFGTEVGSMSPVSANDECVADLCDDQSNPDPDCRNDVIPEPAPAECPYETLEEGPGKLRIVDYVDGDIPASNCMVCADSTRDAWPGTFGHSDLCLWEIPGYDLFSIYGKALYPPSHVILESSHWTVLIVCENAELDLFTVWEGHKVTGSTPMGEYLYDSGCAGPSVGGPSALTIEEVT